MQEQMLLMGTSVPDLLGPAIYWIVSTWGKAQHLQKTERAFGDPGLTEGQ